MAKFIIISGGTKWHYMHPDVTKSIQYQQSGSLTQMDYLNIIMKKRLANPVSWIF